MASLELGCTHWRPQDCTTEVLQHIPKLFFATLCKICPLGTKLVVPECTAARMYCCRVFPTHAVALNTQFTVTAGLYRTVLHPFQTWHSTFQYHSNPHGSMLNGRYLRKVVRPEMGYPHHHLFSMWPILGQTSWRHILQKAPPPPHHHPPGPGQPSRHGGLQVVGLS